MSRLAPTLTSIRTPLLPPLRPPSLTILTPQPSIRPPARLPPARRGDDLARQAQKSDHHPRARPIRFVSRGLRCGGHECYGRRQI
eukprot:scaffold8684_cov112-Isochrysis_galbana.AAC.4